jgi:hypothetical protein
MKPIRRAALLMALVAMLVTVFALPATAASPFLDRFSDKGREAIADGFDCEFDGRVETCEFVFIRAHDGWINNNGDVLRGEVLCIDRGVDVYDTQTDQWSARIQRGCSPASVAIAKDLSSATASGDVDVELEECADDECQVVGSDTLSVRLRVDGYGDISSSRGSWVDTFGTCRAAGNYRGTFNEGEPSASVDGAAVEVGYGHIAKGRSKFSLRCGG